MNHQVNLVFLFVALFLFVVWFYGPWQTLCVDWARQTMFEARNKIFDLADQGKLSFESPEYRQIRERINTSIRFAHRVSWPTMLTIYIGIRRLGIRRDEKDSLYAIAARIPNKAVRAEVTQHISEVSWALVLMLIARSTILMSLAVIGGIAVLCYAPVKVLLNGLSEELVVTIQNDAETIESHDTGHERAT